MLVATSRKVYGSCVFFANTQDGVNCLIPLKRVRDAVFRRVLDVLNEKQATQRIAWPVSEQRIVGRVVYWTPARSGDFGFDGMG